MLELTALFLVITALFLVVTTMFLVTATPAIAGQVKSRVVLRQWMIHAIIIRRNKGSQIFHASIPVTENNIG